MRAIGFVLVTIGFLGGALAAVLDEHVVHWEGFAVAVALGIAGAVLVRASHRRQVRAVERLTSNMAALEQSLRRVVANMARLNADQHGLDPYDVRHRIEELFADDLNTFVEARESIAHSCGLSAYAEVMSPFAAGERCLNRAWCASADGYVDEIDACLGRAQEQFAASLDKVLTLQAPAAPEC